MIIPTGIEILQPCKRDVPGPGVGPCLIMVRTASFVCIRPARSCAGVDESRLLIIKVGQGRQQRKTWNRRTKEENPR